MKAQERANKTRGTTTSGRWARLAVLAAVAATGLVACGGSGSPHVASLATTRRSSTASTTPDSGGDSTTNPSTSGNATRLVDKWAACMRSHGDSGQADPIIDANRVIHVTLPAGYYGGLGLGGKAGTNACAVYMNRVIDAFQSGLHFPDHAQVLAFSKCMRANGVPDFPDPIGGNLAFNIASGGDLNPTNPTFQNATALCDKRTGAGFSSTPPPGAIVLNGVLPGARG